MSPGEKEWLKKLQSELEKAKAELEAAKKEAVVDFAAKLKAEFEDEKWYRGIEVKTRIKLKEIAV
jgi:uncharacterized membrane-anchored protein YhcB (DUF1043 family)